MRTPFLKNISFESILLMWIVCYPALSLSYKSEVMTGLRLLVIYIFMMQFSARCELNGAEMNKYECTPTCMHTNIHTRVAYRTTAWLTAPCTVSIVFFLFSNVGRGNECTVAAGFTEIPSDSGENPNEQVSLCLQKMVNKTKVTDLLCFCEFNCILCDFFQFCSFAHFGLKMVLFAHLYS